MMDELTVPRLPVLVETIDEALGTVASELHEDSRSACLATDSVSLAVERFEASTHCTFVIDEFNHNVRLRFIRPASLS